MENNDTITVDNVEHKIADLTEEQKYCLRQLQSLDAKMKEQQFQYDQLTAARFRFTNLLTESLASNAKETQEQAEE